MSKILEHSTLLTVLLAIVLVVASVLVLNWTFQPTMDGIEWQEDIHIVQTGDTLWAISGIYCPGSVDRNEYIEEIRALNGMTDSIIYPGQALTVLAPVKEG